MADIGWITGHSYVVYGPLANGATTVLFESTPTYPNPGMIYSRLPALLPYTFLSLSTSTIYPDQGSVSHTFMLPFSTHTIHTTVHPSLVVLFASYLHHPR